MKIITSLSQLLVLATMLETLTASATDLVWIGGTGNWNAAGNWTPAQVPTAADNAFITNTGTYTVTVPAGTTATAASVTVGGSSGTQTLALDRATLTLNSASVVNANGELALTLSGSVLTGSGNLVVNGLLNWPNGTMSGTGVTTIGSGGVMAIGSGGVTLGRTLNNSGSGTWAGGNLAISAGGTFNNLADGRFDITADGRLSGGASTPINNSGLFRQAGGTVSTIITAPVNNSGNLQVLAAALNLNLGGTHTGTFSNAPGASLNFGGGSHVMTASSLLTGTGTLTLSGNGTTLTASGTFNSGSTLTVSGGLATLSGTCNVTGATLNIAGAGGILNYNSAGSVSALNLSGGTLGGTGPVVVSGPLILGGGAVTNALLTANGGLTINGNTTLNGTKLVNPIFALWSAGNLTGANGAVVSNLPSATFINSFDGNAGTGVGATPMFINSGVFRKTNGTAALGTTSIDFQFINIGTVEVQTNTLRYNINQQLAGLTLLDGGGLSAQSQPIQFLGGSLVGSGPIIVANVQNVINSAAISPGEPFGELDISGNYQQTASGVLNIDLGGYSAGTNFDLITVAAGGAGGVATLGGTLNVTLAEGFSPTNGASFSFLTAASRVGAFARFNYPSNDIGLQVNYGATAATIKVTNLKPVVANPIPNPAPITYGSSFSFQFAAFTFADPDNNPLTYTAMGLPPGITFTPSTQTFSGTPTQAGIFPVAVIANDGGVPNLTATNTFSITIDPATLTVSALPQFKTYGAADPALTYGVSGLQFADTTATVLSGALARAAGENVAGSPYAITQGTLAANSNYTISFTGSILTTAPAPLSVAAEPKTKIYGASDPAFTVSYLGFVNGETPAVLDGALTFIRAPGENVSTYAISPSGLTSGNYAITFNPGILTVTRAPLSVSADAKSKIYGTTDPAFTVTYSGLVNGDAPSALAGALAYSRAPGENVGDYLITPSGLTNGNYAITFNPANLTITKAALSVTAEAKSKTYGSLDPAFTVTYAGFVNGETLSVLGGSLGFTRVDGETVGSYAITPNGLTSGNYTIAFNSANLTITRALLSVTADAKTKTYGANDPSLTYSASGWRFADTAATVLTGALVRVGGESVAGSPYAITQGTLLANTNYAIDFTGSTLTISRAPLSVTADAKTKIYGANDPAFTASYSGFVNGQAPAVLSGALTFSRAPGENVGSYLITPSGLTSVDYAITFNSGTLTITAPAPSILSVTPVGSGTVLITWTAVSNGTYRVQYESILGPSNWAELSGNVTAIGSSASKTDILTMSNRFYRIKVMP